MAKVLNPLNSSEARGRVGGLVYNTWRGIRTVKTHTDPGHQDDPKRVAHKIIVQESGQRWKTITNAQRAAWEHFANTHTDIDWTGRPVRLAGFHWYVRIQTRLIDAFQEYIDDPPETPCTTPPLNPAYHLLDDKVHITWDYLVGTGSNTHNIRFCRTHLHSAGRHPTFHDAYYIGHEDYSEPEKIIGGHSPGVYTYFLRNLKLNGMAATWELLRVTVLPW